MLTVASAPISRNGYIVFECVCDCGTMHSVESRNLRYGHTKSCGCLMGKHKQTHNKTKTPEFMAWCNMRARCYPSPNSIYYKNYGSRGITVCERWMKFENFLADMGERPSSDYSLDRIDNDGNYEPTNCRWASHVVQSNNTRKVILLTHDGITLPLSFWGRRLNVHPNTLYSRLMKGWPVAMVLQQPLKRQATGIDKGTARKRNNTSENNSAHREARILDTQRASRRVHGGQLTN